jgi:hypothetical protein
MANVTPTHLPQLLSGARGKIEVTKADGSKETLAFATDISVSVNHDIRTTYVVGSSNPVALDPVGYDVSCSIGRIFPINTTTAETKNANGETVSVKVLADTTAIQHKLENEINKILERDSMTITITDKQTNQTIASIQGARFTGRSFSVSSGDVASERYNFVGLYDAASNNSTDADGLGYGKGVDTQ